MDVILTLATITRNGPKECYGYPSYNSLNGLLVVFYFQSSSCVSRLGWSNCVCGSCVSGVALWPQLHCSSTAMDRGPERKPTHSQQAVIPVGYNPNNHTYKSAWFVPEYSSNLACEFQHHSGLLSLLKWAIFMQNTASVWKKCYFISHVHSTIASLINHFKMCLFYDASFNCILLSLSHLRGFCAVTDDAAVVSCWFLLEAISVVCLFRAALGYWTPSF